MSNGLEIIRSNSRKQEGFSKEFDEDFVWKEPIWRKILRYFRERWAKKPTWREILNFFKKKWTAHKEKIKKMTEDEKWKRNARIATIWRVINWLIVYAVLSKFITFLFIKTSVGSIYKVVPGVQWSSATKMVFFFICLCIALAASKETHLDPFRFKSGVTLITIPTILMFVIGEVGLLSLFIAGSVTFSMYREKIYTDAKVRRTPAKKHRTEIEQDEKKRRMTIDRYQV